MHSLWHRLLRTYIAGAEHPAKYRLVRWLGRHAMRSEGIVAKVQPGVLMWLNPTDWIEYLLLRDGIYEPLTLDFIRQNLQRGDHAICAGINNGLHEIVAAMAVGQGFVVGCDPQPGAILKVRSNMSLNGISERSLRLVQAALGAPQERGLRFMAWAAADNPGSAGLGDDGVGFMVAVVTIADVVKELAISHLRFMLLDVQGHELEALAGLGDCKPEVVLLEDGIRYERRQEDRATLYARLRNLGYRLFDVTGSVVAEPAEPPAERSLVGALEGCAVNFVVPRSV